MKDINNLSMYILGALLNSFSSVLSYNSFDLDEVLSSGEKKRENLKENRKTLHEPTFVKQLLYFLLMGSMNLG